MPPLISVIILNWNGRAYLENCLAALQSQTYPAFEIIVVDNGSTDGSVDWLGGHHPGVRVIANPENRGFAAGNNQGAQAARGDYLALLNNDTQVAPAWLAELARVLETDPQCGMAFGKRAILSAMSAWGIKSPSVSAMSPPNGDGPHQPPTAD